VYKRQLVGDFGTALKEVLNTYAPDRILIEPSGVGKLSDVVKAVENVAGSMDVRIDSSIVVVDGKKCKMYMKNFGEFFNNQIEHAGTIVLSRTQSMTDEKLEACVELLREHNAKATMITTPWDDLNGKQILDAMHHTELNMEEHGPHDHHHGDECCHHHHHEEDHHHHHEHEGGHDHHHHEHGEDCTCGCHDHHHHHSHEGHHHADEIFSSWGVETPHKYSTEELQQILEELSNSEDYGLILRAKGILAGTDGGWLQFDFVPEEYEVRGGSPDYTGRLCVIGSKLNEEALKKLFHV
jgi:G3E family GTPase